MDIIAIGAASWWIMGHAIANGDDSFRNSGVNGVFGTSGFGYINAATVGKPGFGGQAEWFFGLSFAATSATIVSGAIAERCNMIPYFLLACLLTSFVYPVVAHVAWHESGRLSAYRDERLAFGCGLLDFAGGGVVHLTGGVAALAAAWSVGPRDNKYTSRGDPVPMRQQSVVLQVLGTLTLWLGWFAFNGGSVLSASRARHRGPLLFYYDPLRVREDAFIQPRRRHRRNDLTLRRPASARASSSTRRSGASIPRPPATASWRASSRSRQAARRRTRSARCSRASWPGRSTARPRTLWNTN